VRFASVYRNFREARDFGQLIDELAHEPEKPEPPAAGPSPKRIPERI
jgi:hypothetical protein